MIDSHSEYTHGLASDMRRRHLPPSSSLNGWDFSKEETDTFPIIFWGIVVILGLIAGAILAAQAGLSS